MHNMNSRNLIAIKALVMSLFIFLQSQGVLAQGFQANIGLQLGFAQSELANNIDKAGFGMALNLGYNFGKVPLLIGIETSVVNFGRQLRRVDVQGTPLAFQAQTRANFIHGVFRLQSNRGFFRPYVDGLAGVSIFATNGNAFVNGIRQAAVFLDDVALSSGVGTGFMIRLRKGREATQSRNSQNGLAFQKRAALTSGQYRRSGRNGGGRTEMLLDLRIRYIFGGTAEYLTEETIGVNGNNFVFQVIESRTNLLVSQIGVILLF